MTGQTIAQYEILEQLGAGGMGVVYKARDTKLDRIVALKFLPPQLSADPKTKERFIQEARAASALDDPHICTIHDIAEAHDGQLFIVMAFYDGTTLKYLIDGGGIDTERACDIARQIALGLATAHDAGIVHRDVKPANIMVTEKGLVKILDFGVAKLGESSDLTRAGSTIGTAAYMSPEQARGESVDSRSDLWSAGAVLYEMISGHRPFGGGYEAAVAYSIINEDPAPLEGIPSDLQAVVSKALSKDPESRQATGKEFADDLASFSGISATATKERVAFPASQRAEIPGVQAVVLKFCGTAVVVLGVLYALMLGLGLPGWVFPTGVFLALAGLPVILYGASLDRQRAALDSGEKARLTGLKSWLTTKKAYQGGLVASAGLILVTLVFVGLRFAGVGPFATLISGGALNSQDAIIVADFQNQTSDTNLGITVTEAFKIDLSQSSAVRMLDRSQVVSALERMQLSPDTNLTSSIALQLAQREGAKAIIEGDINAAGAGFILNARIISGVDGTQLAAFRENASSNADILDAIDKLSASLREGIGESLIDIRASAPLDQVTTSNVEALRLYTEAEDQSSVGDLRGALEKMKRVIQLDSTFAMAYRKLAVLYGNIGEPDYLVKQTITKGYALRDRLPWRERMLTEAYYFRRVEEDRDEETRRYEEVLRRYPYEVPALNNLALNYGDEGRHAEAEQLVRRALEVDEGWTFRLNLLISIAQQGRRDDAFKASDEFEAAIPGHLRSAQWRMYLEFTDENFAGAEAWLDSVASRGQGLTYEKIAVLDDRDNLMMAQGRLDEGRRFHEEMLTLNRNRLDWDKIPYTRHADSLRMVLDLEWERALLSGERSKWLAAFEQVEANEEFQNRPDSLHGPDGWLGWMAATMGDLERADKYRQNHIDYHKRHPEDENGEWGRIVDAYGGLKTGILTDVDAVIKEIEVASAEQGCAEGGCWRDMLGEIEESRGNAEKAIEYYEHYADGFRLNKLALDEGSIAAVSFRLGALNEQVGNIDEAIRRYTYFIERWENADAILLPQVAEARRRIDVLLDRKAREGK